MSGEPEETEDDIIQRSWYNHRCLERLVAAMHWNGMRESYSEHEEELIADIRAVQSLFRTYLEDTINGVYRPPLTPEAFQQRIVEAFERSDFDWADKERLTAFGKWYFQ